MTTTLRAQVTIPRETALPADVATNTWHFVTLTTNLVTATADVVDQLDAFYSACGPIWTDKCDTDWIVKIYDLQDDEPRIPILESGFVQSLGTGSPLPAECAITLSFRGEAASGANMRRRSGRIFLGPLDTIVLAGRDGDAAIDSGVIGDIVAAADALIAAGVASDTKWATFSPSTAAPEPWTDIAISSATFQVASGWVDDAFDTIRSRGVAPTSRQTFAI